LLAFLGLSEPALAAEPCPHVNGIESLRVVRKVMDGVAAALAFRALGYVCGGGSKEAQAEAGSDVDVDGRLLRSCANYQPNSTTEVAHVNRSRLRRYMNCPR
jgi:hypothetical protein